MGRRKESRNCTEIDVEISRNQELEMQVMNKPIKNQKRWVKRKIQIHQEIERGVSENQKSEVKLVSLPRMKTNKKGIRQGELPEIREDEGVKTENDSHIRPMIELRFVWMKTIHGSATQTARLTTIYLPSASGDCAILTAMSKWIRASASCFRNACEASRESFSSVRNEYRISRMLSKKTPLLAMARKMKSKCMTIQIMRMNQLVIPMAPGLMTKAMYRKPSDL
mmetsp:Transcript_1319/g.2195  ORF Transcript_1319/g.2195 Transcript_1319/m.2195 type:complete len:224 (+) Transcript_1319:628-1299(+)